MVVVDDYSNIEEPRTNREMYQKIIRMIQEDRHDRQEDRELLEKFIEKQDELNKAMDDQLKKFSECLVQHTEVLGTLRETSKKWDVTNSLGVIIVAILSALGFKN
jgi:hypothetical protein